MIRVLLVFLGLTLCYAFLVQLGRFDAEDETCDYMLSRLLRDPTTRSR